MAKKGKIYINNKSVSRDMEKKMTRGGAKKNPLPLIVKLAICLGFITFCIYANTLQNDYALDDWSVIQSNSLVKKGIPAIPEIMVTPYHYGINTIADNKMPANDLYRPLSLVMFAIECQFAVDQPLVGHFMNILLYVGCVIAFFCFIYSLFRNEKPGTAFVAALLFAVHPIHTEVVANIKSADELLCFLFMLLSLNSFMKYVGTSGIRPLITGSFFFFLSLLSKETSITFVVVVPLIFFFYRKENRKKSISIFVLSIATALFYLVLRQSVLSAYNAANFSLVTFYQNALVGAPSFTVRLATEISILGSYLKLMVVPYPLVSDYSYSAIPFVNFNDIQVWLSLIAYIYIIYFGISGLIKKKYGPVTFGALFFIVTIALFSNIFFFIQCEMAERFMFVPSAGFCLAFAGVLERSVSKSGDVNLNDAGSKKLALVLAPLIVSLVFITITRNGDWKDNFTLILTDSRKSPNNFRLHFYVAQQDIIKMKENPSDPVSGKMYVDALIQLRKCISIYPEYTDAYDALGYDFMMTEQLDSSEKYNKKALALNPDDVVAMNNLAIIYCSAKKYQESIALDRRALTIDQTNSYYMGNIGVCYVHTNRFDSAICYLRNSINIDKTNLRYTKYLAKAFYANNQIDSSKKYESIVNQSDPAFSVVNTILSN